jgi:hypothetical protein
MGISLSLCFPLFCTENTKMYINMAGKVITVLQTEFKMCRYKNPRFIVEKELEV